MGATTTQRRFSLRTSAILLHSMERSVPKGIHDCWFSEYFLPLKELNLQIIERCLGDYDEQSSVRDTHEQIRVLLDMWINMPDDECREQMLYELVHAAGEMFLYHDICRSKDDNLEIALRLFQHASHLGRVIFSTDANESMLATLAELGVSYSKKDMALEAIEHFQLALAMGKELDNANQHGDKDAVNDEEAFLLRMIIICNSLGDFFRPTNIDLAIDMCKQSINYYRFEDLQIEDFDEMLRLHDNIGILALEKDCDVNEDVLEHVELGLSLRENHAGKQSPELLPTLVILRDLYARNENKAKEDCVARTIRNIERGMVRETHEA
jgi:tetratricopeptide (TPR) repeat protein